MFINYYTSHSEELTEEDSMELASVKEDDHDIDNANASKRFLSC